MKNRLVLGLSVAAGAVLVLLVGFLAGSFWTATSTTPSAPTTTPPEPPRQPGESVTRSQLTNPPPPPKPVAVPERVRQNLQPGKTYVTHTKGTLHMRGEDKAWAIAGVHTINYAFEAQIDREIESNDGTTIVELRHFRDVRSLKFESRLDDVRIDLGPLGQLLLPEAWRGVDKLSLAPVLSGLRLVGVEPEKLAGLDENSAQVFSGVDHLSGKSVRLTYKDGGGVQKVEPVKGEMTRAEKDFYFASAILSDSLIFPNVEVKIDNRWTVDGSNFTNLMDPGLLARTSGEIILERTKDHIVGDKTCRHLQIQGGRILFEDSDPRVGRIGHFTPEGSFDFFPGDQIIIKAYLKGKAKLDKFSKDHLLFETRSVREPELEVLYSCRVVPTLKMK
jgi:hypothetical protein